MPPRSWLFVVSLLAASALCGAEARSQQSVGTLDFFGLRRLTEAEVRAKLKLKEGDPYRSGDAKSIIADLQQIPGVWQASLAPITVDGSGKLCLFIGIQEEGVAGFALRETPSGEKRLPDEMARLYRDTMQAWSAAVKNGTGTEEHSQGHALSKDPALRKFQDNTVAALKENAPLVQELRDVLASSSQAFDRGAAAWLLGYAPDKKQIVADLAAAARDPDGTVRNNATRGLGVIADYAAAKPKLGIEIDPAVFIAMLGSVTWTDRNKASFLLDGMTKSRPAGLLAALRKRALPELNEMARWKSEGHSGSAILILGRIAGWKDNAIIQAWQKGEAEKVIAAAAATKLE